MASPVITSADQVSTAGGTTNIFGTGFTGVTDVKLDGSSVSFIITNDTIILATAPSHAAGSVDIYVENPDGNDTLVNGLTYVTPAAITGMTGPTTGDYITGQSLTFTVTYDGPVTVVGTPQITLVIGDTNTVCNYVSGSGTDTLTFTYTPILATDYDANGLAYLGTSISTLISSICNQGTTALASLDFSGVAPDISGVTVNAFITILSISPNQGPGAGGNTVTLTTTSTAGISGVQFDGDSATDVTAIDSTHITCKPPAEPAWAVGVVAVSSSGNGPTFSSYTYVAAAAITAMTGPSVQDYQAGQDLTFTVTFDTPITVDTGGSIGNIVLHLLLNGSPLTVFYDSKTSTTITFKHSVAADEHNNTDLSYQDLSIQLSGAASIQNVNVPQDANVDFTGVAPSLVGITLNYLIGIVSISPNRGPVAGGNTVTLIVTSTIATVSNVWFTGDDASNVTTVDLTTITCKPPAEPAGAVGVVVVSPNGAGPTFNSYTYVNATNKRRTTDMGTKIKLPLARKQISGNGSAKTVASCTPPAGANGVWITAISVDAYTSLDGSDPSSTNYTDRVVADSSDRVEYLFPLGQTVDWSTIKIIQASNEVNLQFFQGE